MKVSVVIPYCNNGFSLVRVLESLLLVKKHDIQVIVVNDGSKDFNEYYHEIYRLINRFKHHNLIILKKNHGRSYARNIGSMKSIFDNLLFLDADRLVSNEIFSNVKFSDNYIEQGIRIGPIFDTYASLNNLRDVDVFLKNPIMIRKYSYYRFFEKFLNEKGYIDLNNPWLATFSGAMLISKKNFFDLNGFDTDFKKWGMENLEFGFRASEKLKLNYYIENSFNTYHLVHKRVENFYDKGIRESTKLFYQKHNDPRIVDLEGFLQGSVSLGEIENNYKFSNIYYNRPQF